MSVDTGPASRLEFEYLRTEMNGVEMAGIIYDLDNSRNDQFNLRYVIQECPDEPEQFVLQSWYNETAFHGDASREAKQRTFYEAFVTIPYYSDYPVNTLAQGEANSLGLRLLRTFGNSNDLHWTVGADWRRYSQRYTEPNLDPSGQIAFFGNIFGIPRSDDGRRGGSDGPDGAAERAGLADAGRAHRLRHAVPGRQRSGDYRDPGSRTSGIILPDSPR